MKIRKHRLGLLVAGIISVALLCSPVAMAADKVVVIPLNSNSKAGVGTVVTTVGGSAWLPHINSPTTVTRAVSATTASGDGLMVLSVTAPTSFGGIEYGLESVEICVRVSAPGYLEMIEIYRTDSATSSPNILADATARTASGCYTYQVGDSVNKGIGVALTLSGGEEIRIEGTTFTWTTSAAAPSTVMSTAATAERSNNR